MRSEGSRCQWGGSFWWAAARIGASAAEWLSLQARDHFISETGTGSAALVVETLGVENPPRATLSTITRSTDDSTIFRRLYSSFSKLRPTGHLPVPHDTHPSPTLTYSPYQVTPIKGLIRWMHDSRSIPSLSRKLAPRESTNRGKTKEKVFLNVKRPFIKMRVIKALWFFALTVSYFTRAKGNVVHRKRKEKCWLFAVEHRRDVQMAIITSILKRDHKVKNDRQNVSCFHFRITLEHISLSLTNRFERYISWDQRNLRS